MSIPLPRERLTPDLSVVIAGFNGECHIPALADVLSASEEDGFARVEVIWVDGGSTDSSCELAESRGFQVIANPEGDAGTAKKIGWIHARSRFVCFLDQDERPANLRSLLRRVSLLEQLGGVCIAVPSGYELEGSVTPNQYGSEFGDPFSYFLYRSPNRAPYREASFRRRLEVLHENDEFIIFRRIEGKPEILLEVAAGATILDKRAIDRSIDTDSLLPQEFGLLYYLLNEEADDAPVLFMKSETVGHSSSDSWSVLARKILWRTRNNAYGNSFSRGGFLGRSNFDQGSLFTIGLSFTVYSVLGGALLDSVRLAMSRRRLGYLMHFPLALLVLVTAARFLLSKFAGKPEKRTRYGQK